MTTEAGGGVGDDGPPATGPIDRRRHVAEYFRLQRWELPPADGAEGYSDLGGRIPLDDHLRSATGGMRTGALITSLDSLGGLLSGLAVLPRWIVTTSMTVTVVNLVQSGPLRLHGRVLRRGRNSVVSGLHVVDEGSGDQPVAVATMACSVLDPGDRDLRFERPYSSPMPPPRPDPPRPEDFFCIEPGPGPVTALGLADTCAIRGASSTAGPLPPWPRWRRSGPSSTRRAAGPLVAADAVLHYLHPNRVGPVLARCEVLGGAPAAPSCGWPCTTSGGRSHDRSRLGGCPGRLSRRPARD